MTKRQTPPTLNSKAKVVIEKPVGPHQWARCSAVVKALNTSSRGAAIRRSMTIERASSGSAAAPDAAWAERVIELILLLKLLQVVFQAIEAALEELAETDEIFGGLLQPRGLQPARSALGVAAAADQAGLLQHVEVLGHRRAGHGERLCQFAHRRLAERQPRQDRPAGGVGERRKGVREMIGHFEPRSYLTD